MKRLIIILLVLLFTTIGGTVSSAGQKKYSVENQFKVLINEVYPEIRKYLKTVELFPYTDEKGAEVVFHVEDIITSNENLFVAKKPIVSLFAVANDKTVQFNLSIVVPVFDDEKIPNIKPIVVFGKYFFIRIYKSTNPEMKKPSGKKYNL